MDKITLILPIQLDDSEVIVKGVDLSNLLKQIEEIELQRDTEFADLNLQLEEAQQATKALINGDPTALATANFDVFSITEKLQDRAKFYEKTLFDMGQKSKQVSIDILNRYENKPTECTLKPDPKTGDILVFKDDSDEQVAVFYVKSDAASVIVSDISDLKPLGEK